MSDFFSEDVLFWGGIILTLLIALYLAGTWNFGEFTKRGMPNPKPWPFFGNYRAFALGKTSRAEMSTARYRLFKDHRAYGIFSFLKPVVTIRDPELISLVSVKDFDFFTDRMVHVDEQDDMLFGKSLFNLKGGRWKEMRSTLSPAFTSSKMKAMFTLIDKCGEQLADYLKDKSKSIPLKKIWSH